MNPGKIRKCFFPRNEQCQGTFYDTKVMPVTVQKAPYNPASELDGPHFELENFFGESELSGGVGWNLIAMDGNVICNIGRNKSDIRNIKNKNFFISKCWKPSDRHFRELEAFRT